MGQWVGGSAGGWVGGSVEGGVGGWGAASVTEAVHFDTSTSTVLTQVNCFDCFDPSELF